MQNTNAIVSTRLPVRPDVLYSAIYSNENLPNMNFCQSRFKMLPKNNINCQKIDLKKTWDYFSKLWNFAKSGHTTVAHLIWFCHHPFRQSALPSFPRYLECNIKGEESIHLCPDGLVFDIYTQNCDYPAKVDCSLRPELRKHWRAFPSFDGYFSCKNIKVSLLVTMCDAAVLWSML